MKRRKKKGRRQRKPKMSDQAKEAARLLRKYSDRPELEDGLTGALKLLEQCERGLLAAKEEGLGSLNRLIVEHIDGDTYVFVEDAETFARYEPRRCRGELFWGLTKTKAVSSDLLLRDCDVNVVSKMAKTKRWHMSFCLA